MVTSGKPIANLKTKMNRTTHLHVHVFTVNRIFLWFQLNRTPLHYAAALSDDLFDLLVAHGADLTVKDVVS